MVCNCAFGHKPASPSSPAAVFALKHFLSASSRCHGFSLAQIKIGRPPSVLLSHSFLLLPFAVTPHYESFSAARHDSSSSTSERSTSWSLRFSFLTTSTNLNPGRLGPVSYYLAEFCLYDAFVSIPCVFFPTLTGICAGEQAASEQGIPADQLR